MAHSRGSVVTQATVDIVSRDSQVATWGTVSIDIYMSIFDDHVAATGIEGCKRLLHGNMGHNWYT